MPESVSEPPDVSLFPPEEVFVDESLPWEVVVLSLPPEFCCVCGGGVTALAACGVGAVCGVVVGLGVCEPERTPDECELLQIDFGCVPSTKYAVTALQVLDASIPEYIQTVASTIFVGLVSSL